MTIADTPPKTPRRRWFQFSLRTLLIVTTLIACGCGWLAIRIERVKHQRAAMDAIRKLPRSEVKFAHETETDPFGPEVKPPGPAWLRWLLGDDFFASVTVINSKDPITDAEMQQFAVDFPDLADVDVESDQLTDGGLANFHQLHQLAELELPRANISDVALQHLRTNNQLMYLRLNGRGVTNAGLQSLASLSKLQWLSIPDSQINDAGLVHLQSLTRLALLELDDSQVTGEDLSPLVKLPHLKNLSLARTRCNDGCLKKFVSQMRQLETLNLAGTKITDDGLGELASIPFLMRLNLNATQIDDAGLQRLVSLKELESLNLNNTAITADGLDRFLTSFTAHKQLHLSIFQTQLTRPEYVKLQEKHQFCTLRYDSD